MRKKRSKNLNPYLRQGIDMNIDDIAKELKISTTEVETALHGGIRKLKKYFSKQNIQKEHYL